MLIPHVVSTEADKVFVNVYNSQSVALADGDVVVWNGTSPDGVKTTQPATATLSSVVGAADGAIASAAYGLAQAYGYKSAVNCVNNKTTAFAVGNILIPVNGQDYLKYSSAADGKSGFFTAAQTFATNSTPAAATKKAFIRCL